MGSKAVSAVRACAWVNAHGYACVSTGHVTSSYVTLQVCTVNPW